MKNGKAILILVGVFLLGVLAGVLGTAKFVQVQMRHFMQGGPEAVGQIIVRRIGHELRLDAPQREKVQAIVTNAAGEIRAARRQIQPQINQTFEKSAAEIRAVLTPGQAQKFDKIVTEGRAHWEHAP